MYRPQNFDPPWIDFFENPCPYYIKQYKSFPKFPELPRELQLMIWEAFEPEAQTFAVDFNPRKRYGYPMNYVPPSILHACRDSRHEGLKHYTCPFSHRMSTIPMYFNLAIDILELGCTDTPEKFMDHIASLRISVGPLARIRYLAVSVSFSLGDEPDFVDELCLWFNGLQHLYVEYAGSGWEHFSTGRLLPRTYAPEELQRVWSSTERFIKYLAADLFDDTVDFRKWRAPWLTIGHKDQWAKVRCFEKSEMVWERA